MKIGIVGETYEQRSLPFDAQRAINLYPVIDEYGKEVASMYSTPGLSLFTSGGTGYVRSGYVAGGGRVFVVIGYTLFELDSLGNLTNRGTLEQSSGNISMADNGLELAICDGRSVYTFIYATNNFAKVTDPDLPSAGTITFLDGYFIVNKVNSGSFYISSLYDGRNWSALDFATAESNPDNLLRVFSASGILWLFGKNTLEAWSNTGDSSFPFQRISGAQISTGILAPHTTVEDDGAVFWVGRDDKGSGIVYQTTGLSPRRISNDAIERMIANATDKEDMVAYIYQQEGHSFYVITGGGLATSLVYDISTGRWHERAYMNEYGEFEQHLGRFCIYAFGKHLIGSRRDNKIYDMSLDYYDDDGDALVRERVYTHIVDEEKRIRYNKLVIGIETGVGNGFDDPQIALQLSKDGARTWSNWYTTSIGKVGQYQTRVSFRRLGITTTMTFKIRISDNVKVAITGSYLS